MKIAGIALIVLATGCATQGQLDSKADYRRQQVEAIKVQAEAKVSQQQVAALERKAMWDALAEVVKANPEAASNVAIVAAVAAARTGEDGESERSIVTLKTEQSDAQSWARLLAAPILSSVTQLGIAAFNTDLQKEISKNNSAVQITEAEQDGKIYEMIGVIAENRMQAGDTYTETTNYTISDEAFLNTGTYSEDNDVSGDTNSDSYNQTSGDTNTDSLNTNTDSYNDNSDNSDNRVNPDPDPEI